MTTETQPITQSVRVYRARLRAEIKKYASAERALHKVYSINHSRPEFKAEASKAYALSGEAWSYNYIAPPRDAFATKITTLHILLAESLGKVHCPTEQLPGWYKHMISRHREWAAKLFEPSSDA